MSERVGTDRYMSPELYEGHKYSPVVADIFALGVILFIFVACHPPFTCASVENEHYRLIKAHKEEEYWKTINRIHNGSLCSDSLKHLLSVMLQYESSFRPSISEIRAHPWLQGELPTVEEVKKNLNNVKPRR